MTSSQENPRLYSPFPNFADWDVNVDTSAFDTYAKRLVEAKKGATSDQNRRVLRRALREAAVDTNAIEGVFSTDRGFTRTVATEAAAWEAAMEAKGSRARAAFEDSLAAYELVLDAVTASHPITEKWIRDLHSTLLRSQDTYDVLTVAGVQAQPLPKGQYKKYENSPSLPGGEIHMYAPVLETAPEMHRFVEQLRTSEFAAAHPVVQAAYSHYAFVAIHPFSDGNGRVSRALASVFLYRSVGVPFVVFDDQKNRYFDALQMADRGDPQPFIQFVSARATDTMALFVLQLGAAGAPAAESLSALTMQLDGGADASVLGPAALRLRQVVLTELRAQLNDLAIPSALEVDVVSPVNTDVQGVEGYRLLGKEGRILVGVNVLFPKKTSMFRSIAVGYRTGPVGGLDLIVVDGRGYSAEFSLEDLEPSETEIARQKARVWSEGFWDAMFADFAKMHANGLHH